MPTPAAKTCSSSKDTSLARWDHSRPCPAALGGSIRIIGARSPHGADGPLHRVVDEQPPGADVGGVDVRIEGAAGADLPTEVELADVGAHEPRHLLGQQAAAGHQH